jgi:uncharacterized protein involved in cysteine biosynthesis
MKNASMHTLALVVIINKTVTLLAWSVAEYAANTTKEKYDDQRPHATSNASTLSLYFGGTLVSTFCTGVFKRFFMCTQLQSNFIHD